MSGPNLGGSAPLAYLASVMNMFVGQQSTSCPDMIDCGTQISRGQI